MTGIALAWTRTVLRLENVLLELCRRLLFAPLTPSVLEAITRIVVFRVGAVGDVLITVPVLSALRRRFPNARICLLTSTTYPEVAGAPDLFADTTLFDDLIAYYASDLATWSGRRDVLQRVRQHPVDLFVGLPMQLTTF